MPSFLSQIKDKVVDKVTEHLSQTSISDQGSQQQQSSGAGSSGSNNYNNYNTNYNTNPPAPPPAWAPAPEISHQYGLYSDAPSHEFEDAEKFINDNPVHAPRLLSSRVVERIDAVGAGAWGFELPKTSRFSGTITNIGGTATSPNIPGYEKFLHYTFPNYVTAYEARIEASGRKTSADGVVRIETFRECKDICLLSDLPIMAGLYDIQGKKGIYYEVKVVKMRGTIAVGTSCRPYPTYRLPGWNRLSAGFHLDDFRKFFEDPDGGRNYVTSVATSATSSMPFIPNPLPPNSVIGCGYEFATGAMFYTYQGQRLPSAFTGIYMPRAKYDVFAAIGMMGENTVEINFGNNLFSWKEGNEWQWKVEGHVGKMAPPQTEPPPPFAPVDPYSAPSTVRPVVLETTGIAPPPSFPSLSGSRPIDPPSSFPNLSGSRPVDSPSSFPSPYVPRPTQQPTTAPPPRRDSPERVPPPVETLPSPARQSGRVRREWGYGDDDDDYSSRRRAREDEAGQSGAAAGSGEDNKNLFGPPSGVKMRSRYDNYGYTDD